MKCAPLSRLQQPAHPEPRSPSPGLQYPRPAQSLPTAPGSDVAQRGPGAAQPYESDSRDHRHSKAHASADAGPHLPAAPSPQPPHKHVRGADRSPTVLSDRRTYADGRRRSPYSRRHRHVSAVPAALSQRTIALPIIPVFVGNDSVPRIISVIATDDDSRPPPSAPAPRSRARHRKSDAPNPDNVAGRSPHASAGGYSPPRGGQTERPRQSRKRAFGHPQSGRSHEKTAVAKRARRNIVASTPLASDGL